MIFSLLISSLIIFEASGVIVACGSGHTWSMNTNLQKYNTDFYYSLGENDIFGSEVSPDYIDGPVLRVGQNHAETIGCSYHKAKCERLLEDDVYLDDYKPKFHVYSDNTGLAGDLFSYFTFTEREVWNCTVTTAKSEVQINFFRIVNVLHGIRPIKTLFYFDGIEVVQDQCSVENSEDRGNLWTATFREIKFVDQSTKREMRYHGKINLSEVNTRESQLSIFKPVDVQELPYDGKFRNEVLEYREKGKVKAVNIAAEGGWLRVGNDNFVASLGLTNQEAICELESENKNKLLFTYEYLPRCSLLEWPIIKEIKFSETYGSPPKKVNSNCFSIIKQETWKCESKNNLIFMRRVSELVGAIPVARIEYYSGVDVWKYRLDSKSYSVKIREIYYHQPSSMQNQIRFCSDDDYIGY